MKVPRSKRITSRTELRGSDMERSVAIVVRTQSGGQSRWESNSNLWATAKWGPRQIFMRWNIHSIQNSADSPSCSTAWQ